MSDSLENLRVKINEVKHKRDALVADSNSDRMSLSQIDNEIMMRTTDQ